MGKKKKKLELNIKDPLSESTPARRLWAARIRAGYKSRESWAHACGVAYSTVDKWERFNIVPEHENLKTACRLAGITLEEYEKGHAGTVRPRASLASSEPPLDGPGIVAVLDELRASLAVRQAVDRVKLTRITRTFLTVFVDDFKQRIDHGEEREAAIEGAWSEAMTAMARADRIAQSSNVVPLKKPVTSDEIKKPPLDELE